MRRLAEERQVSVATVLQAYLRLENAGAGGELAARILDTNAVPYWAMFAATIISVWSGIRYFRKNWEAVCLELEEAERVEP